MLARYVDETFEKPIEYMHFFKDIFFYDGDYEGSKSALNFWTSICINATKLNWDICTYKDIPKMFFRTNSDTNSDKVFIFFRIGFINDDEIIDDKLKDCTIKEIIDKLESGEIKFGILSVLGGNEPDQIKEYQIVNNIDQFKIKDILADDWIIYI